MKSAECWCALRKSHRKLTKDRIQVSLLAGAEGIKRVSELYLGGGTSAHEQCFIHIVVVEKGGVLKFILMMASAYVVI